MDGLLIVIGMLGCYALGRRHGRESFVGETRRALARRVGMLTARGERGLR